MQVESPKQNIKEDTKIEKILFSLGLKIFLSIKKNIENSFQEQKKLSFNLQIDKITKFLKDCNFDSRDLVDLFQKVLELMENKNLSSCLFFLKNEQIYIYLEINNFLVILKQIKFFSKIFLSKQKTKNLQIIQEDKMQIFFDKLNKYIYINIPNLAERFKNFSEIAAKEKLDLIKHQEEIVKILSFFLDQSRKGQIVFYIQNNRLNIQIDSELIKLRLSDFLREINSDQYNLHNTIPNFVLKNIYLQKIKYIFQNSLEELSFCFSLLSSKMKLKFIYLDFGQLEIIEILDNPLFQKKIFNIKNIAFYLIQNLYKEDLLLKILASLSEEELIQIFKIVLKYNIYKYLNYLEKINLPKILYLIINSKILYWIIEIKYSIILFLKRILLIKLIVKLDKINKKIKHF